MVEATERERVFTARVKKTTLAVKKRAIPKGHLRL